MEKSGLVWTSLKSPNWGFPYAAKPRLSRASRSTCSKPIFFFGQPSARAKGSHIAMTRGVRAIDGLSRGASGRSESKFRSRPHSDEAGDHATGCSAPRAILLSASPEAITCPSTNTGLPPLLCPSSLKRRISGFKSTSFSGE